MVGIGKAGITEWNYTSWTKKWVNKPSNDFREEYRFDVLIDEKNDVLSISWQDSSMDNRFAVYNLSDFSVVFESPLGSNYTYSYPELSTKAGATLDMAYINSGGLSRSLQTYFLLGRQDQSTIEVWRGGSSPLWSRDTNADAGFSCYCKAAAISLRGKYILAFVHKNISPYDDYFILYEGH